ncbi:SDR family NAD(P)-dependent oxidoreductase [Bremerella cremea]|uniref:Oxidoreductase n=1 Tax=Blastopirellula marina TaxID=124 RepID=A0A2S8FEG5_9BACT|nr:MULTISPECIES: SDR family oxidoreductase [Pirellulaceae]PQO30537.1 oxidoreductase [Blastopirellula marina]RCS43890.1 SDR family NAD(P)-dependent oxidoreductase [Bremerella cremea]
MASRKIVVTGVTKGLGRAMVDGFIDAGHQVAGCGRSADKIDGLAEQYGSPHRFDVVDVTNDKDVERWGNDVTASFGVPDLLINNAAIINENNPVWQVPTNEFSHIVDINIKGVFHVLKAFVPAMIEQKSGVIINISSGWGRTTSPEVGPYCATKYAIEGLTKSLAQELPEGMAAIPLGPGMIHTEMLEKCFSDGASSAPSPQQWAEYAVPFILSLGADESGQSISIVK